MIICQPSDEPAHYLQHIRTIEDAWALNVLHLYGAAAVGTETANPKLAAERSAYFHARSLLWSREEGRFLLPRIGPDYGPQPA